MTNLPIVDKGESMDLSSLLARLEVVKRSSIMTTQQPLTSTLLQDGTPRVPPNSPVETYEPIPVYISIPHLPLLSPDTSNRPPVCFISTAS